MKKILVTGASGNLGRAAVATFSAAGFGVRAASRHPEHFRDDEVETVRFDYVNRDTYQPALEGVDSVLLIAPPLDVEANVKVIPFIDQAKASGVTRFVLNSALGVDSNEAAALRKVERHLMASGVGYTILRPNFFMENFSTGFLAPMVRQGAIYLAAGDGKTSFISVKDIAAVAAAAFAGGHEGKEYNLTGPQALDHYEVTRLLSQAAGREIAYQAIPEEAMIQGAVQNGLPRSSAEFMAFLYSIVRNGWAAGVTDDVQRVTGRAPLPFEEFVRQSAPAWR